MADICFLFNHDQTHQIAHSLPIALCLAEDDRHRITIAAASDLLEAEIRRLAGDALSRVAFVRLGVSSALGRTASALLNRLVPARKLAIYRDNLDFFRRFDAIIVSEKSTLLLKTRYGLDRVRLIHTRHGAGDRAIGFDKASAGFDHILCSGRKIRDRLTKEAGIDPARISIVGYPKFDIAPGHSIPPGLAKDGRPIVLYNPHPSPHLSSWFLHGRAVLDFFLEHDEYRLVLAPHVMLFERRFVVTIDRFRIDTPGRIDEKYLRAPNIHIDLGSSASTDMTYTNLADIYLGDASSQVYEFLRIPRPCLFLNSHGVDFAGDPNYAHWRAGPVVDRPDQLGDGLEQALATHATIYKPVQRKLFDDSFDLTGEPSSIRAARVVTDLCDKWSKESR